jgi:hypothetical protein
LADSRFQSSAIPMNPKASREGLSTARLLMVLGSISPLFILWAFRGSKLICDQWLIPICLAMVVLPNFFLWWRLRTAQRLNEKRSLVIGRAEDHRDHLLVYLFAMLLPFYSQDIDTWRNLWSTLVALMFIVFLFWHLNLHYMNLFFALKRYHVFTVYAPADGNPLTGRTSFALVTRCVALTEGERISAYVLSDTVYLETDA